MMNSLNEIRSTYIEEKRALDKGSNIWIYLVMRRLSFYVTWACLKLGISANQATFIGITIGILGCVFLARGGQLNIIIGALLVNTWTLFDCVDGNLARLTKSYSKYGWFIDSLTGSMMTAFLLISIGIGVFNHPDYIINMLIRFLPIGIQIYTIKSLFLILGACGSLAALFYALIIQLFENQFSKSLFPNNKKDKSSSGFYLVMLKLGKYLAGFGLIEPALLVVALFNCPSLLVLFYALINTSASVFIVVKSIQMAKKIN